MSIGTARRLPLGITTDSRRGAISRRLRTLAAIAAMCVVAAAGFLVAERTHELIAAKPAYAPTAERRPAVGRTPAEELASPAVTEVERRAAQPPAGAANVQPPASAQQPPLAAAETAPAAASAAIQPAAAQAPAVAADMPGPVIIRRLPGEAAAEPATLPQPQFEAQVSRPARRAEGALRRGPRPNLANQIPDLVPMTGSAIPTMEMPLTEEPRYPWWGYPPHSWMP